MEGRTNFFYKHYTSSGENYVTSKEIRYYVFTNIIVCFSNKKIFLYIIHASL